MLWHCWRSTKASPPVPHTSTFLTSISLGTKFAVTYASEAELRQRIVPGAPPAVNFYVEMMLQNLRTDSDRISYEHANVNELFPDIKPMKVEEFVRTWWGGKQVA